MSERLAQVVFLEKFGVRFEKVSKKEDLGSTKRGSFGFGSTGITVIKKMKTHEEVLDSQDDLEITAEEDIITMNDKVIVNEKIQKK